MSTSTRFTFTLNNYNDDNIAALAALPCTYLCYAKEVAPSTGTPHLQGYVVFKSAKRVTGVAKLIPGAHIEIAKGTTQQSVDYCSKSADLVEHGLRPKSSKQTAIDQKEQWRAIIASAEAGKAKEEYPRQWVQYNNTLTRLYSPALADLPSYTGLWFYGPPGTGKSRAARARFPGFYDKLINKWWDGYSNEETVLIDDVSLDHAFLGSFLKRWVDHYPFRAEFKGGSKMIRPQRVVVTSNYTIKEIWPQDVPLQDALLRRFTQVPFGPPASPPGWIINRYTP